MTATPYRGAAIPDALLSQDFSLVVVDSPLFHLLRRLRLCDERLGLVHRRMLLAVLVLWAPPVALSLPGMLQAPGPGTPLLEDIGFHVRFLITAPLLILAEPVVHLRLRMIVGQFQARGLVPARQAALFDQAVLKAARMRNSVLFELVLLGLVYAAGILFTLHRYVGLGHTGWFSAPGGGLSPAGFWLVFVSLPILQLFLLRWYFRLFIWARFLWRVSRIDLDLNATHPDKAAGLGFLSESMNAFVPIAAAHGFLFAGMIANRILYEGAALTDFELELFTGAVFLIVVFAGPLIVFTPKLVREKRLGLLAYGRVGQSYVRTFSEKWLRGGADPCEPLIGSGDIQSLADLGNSYSAAEQTRVIPLTLRSLLPFAAAFLLPILPLVLTVMPAEQLLGKLVGIVF
jgi:hypothetical protein